MRPRTGLRRDTDDALQYTHNSETKRQHTPNDNVTQPDRQTDRKRSDLFFRSSVTRSDSNCGTETLHSVRHEDLLCASVSSWLELYCELSDWASACPCTSSAAHHASVCHAQVDHRIPVLAAGSHSYGWRVQSNAVGQIAGRLQCQICRRSVELQCLVSCPATWYGRFAADRACEIDPTSQCVAVSAICSIQQYGRNELSV